MSHDREQVKRAVRLQRAVEDVLDECQFQVEQFGVQRHHPAYWLAIMGKQVGQFGSAVLSREWVDPNAPVRNGIAADRRLRNEAVQMAAVALSIIEAIDSGDTPVGLTTAKPSDPRQLARALNRGDESLDYDRDQVVSYPGQHLNDNDHPIGEPGTEPCS